MAYLPLYIEISIRLFILKNVIFLWISQQHPLLENSALKKRAYIVGIEKNKDFKLASLIILQPNNWTAFYTGLLYSKHVSSESLKIILISNYL